jgi:hypothetical protein
LWLVVAGWVEGELAQQLPGVFSEDADVPVQGQDQHAGAGMAAAQPDVVQAAARAQGDHAAGIDLVAAQAGVGRQRARAGQPGTWGGFGPGGVGLGGRAAAQRAVGSLGVVVGPEGVELWAWSCSAVVARGWRASHFLRVWWKRSTLPQVCG